mmetsp:Transcript_43501/g.85157  ORF Transcript_43501/g.85157 Transcript_43501/m.85157 type:complete len:302 (-) Transcript_43501:661-1566(-)
MEKSSMLWPFSVQAFVLTFAAGGVSALFVPNGVGPVFLMPPQLAPMPPGFNPFQYEFGLENRFLGHMVPPEIAEPEHYHYHDWHHCNASVSNNVTNDLFEQLVKTRDALEACKQTAFILDGTLMGAWREHGMNPYEIDNDIVIYGEEPAMSCFKEFWIRGLVLFKSDIWRVCTKRKGAPRKDNSPPFAGGKHLYFPYTDLYPYSRFLQANFEQGIYDEWDGQIIKKNFGPTWMPSPPQSFTYRLLTKRFGNWFVPTKKDGIRYVDQEAALSKGARPNSTGNLAAAKFPPIPTAKFPPIQNK